MVICRYDMSITCEKCVCFSSAMSRCSIFYCRKRGERERENESEEGEGGETRVEPRYLSSF